MYRDKVLKPEVCLIFDWATPISTRTGSVAFFIPRWLGKLQGIRSRANSCNLAQVPGAHVPKGSFYLLEQRAQEGLLGRGTMP